MNFRHLELFVAVAETGGFTAAASRLQMEQPAVSAVVKRLEEELGVRLFLRERRRVALTAEGQMFLVRSRTILEELSASRRDLAAMQSLRAGRIRLGAPPMVAGYLLPEVLHQFLCRYPDVRVTVVQAGAEQISARVLAGELDLGVVADWHTPEGLHTSLLQLHPMVTCVAPRSRLAAKRRLTWAELFDEPLVLFPRGYYQRSRLEEAAARLGRRLDVRLEAESIPLIGELVRRGYGAATLLEAAAHALRGVHVLRLPPDATVPVAICERAHASGSAAASAFHQFARDRLSRRVRRSGDGDQGRRSQGSTVPTT